MRFVRNKKTKQAIKERGKVYQNIAKIIHSWLPFPSLIHYGLASTSSLYILLIIEISNLAIFRIE